MSPARTSVLALSFLYHGPGLDLPELPVLPCPKNCLFWPGSAFAGSARDLAVFCHALFHVLHVFHSSVWLYLSYRELVTQEATVHQRKYCFSLNCPPFKSQTYHSEHHKHLDSTQGTFSSVFFQQLQKSLIFSRSDYHYQA